MVVGILKLLQRVLASSFILVMVKQYLDAFGDSH